MTHMRRFFASLVREWAGSAQDRKSQSSVKFKVDGCPLYSARNQKTRAHPSGEADFSLQFSTTSGANVAPRSLVVSCSWDWKFGLNSWTARLHVVSADAKEWEQYVICQRTFFGYSSW